MTRRSRIVPEFTRTTKRPRAGFIPGDGDSDVEVLQIFCRNAQTGDERRAEKADLRAAGYVQRKRGGK